MAGASGSGQEALESPRRRSGQCGGVSKQRLSIEIGGHCRGIRGAKETAVDIEGDATRLAERGFLKTAGGGADDGGANRHNVKRERPARHADRRIAGSYLYGVMAGSLQILRVQANTRPNGRSRGGRCKNHFNLRLGINGSGIPRGVY